MNKALILVVEDDAPIRNLITTTLKTRDYKYLVAANGESALMEAASHNPDIILLDLGLPDMDGIEIIKQIRSWSNIPIIVISARSEDTDKIEALDQGADDYLTKPFSVEELLARLRVMQRRLAMISAGTLSSSSVFVNGNLKVDYVAGCAYLGEKELHLTPLSRETSRNSTSYFSRISFSYSPNTEKSPISVTAPAQALAPCTLADSTSVQTRDRIRTLTRLRNTVIVPRHLYPFM